MNMNRRLRRATLRVLSTALLLALPVNSFATPFASSEKQSLYEAVNATWLSDHPIPSDKPGVTNFNVLQDVVDEHLRALLEEKVSGERLSKEAQQARALYSSFLNWEEREDVGLDAIEEELEEIDELKTHHQVALHFAKFLQKGIASPLVWVRGPDFKDSKRNLLWLSQSGLGMPARAMYLGEDERSKTLRTLYVSHLETLLALAEIESPKETAGQVMALEVGLATIQWDPEQTRDVQRSYNVKSVDELSALAGTVPVKEIFELLEIPPSVQINVAQLSYVEAFKDFFISQPVAAWKSYLKSRLLTSYSSLLTKDFHKADVEYQKSLGLIQGDSPEWKQALRFVESAAPMLLGKLYVERYFGEEKRKAVEGIVHEIRGAAQEMISASKKVSPETKRRALNKLELMSFNIGYPEVWQDFSSLKVDDDDLLGNFQKASLYELRRGYDRLLKPVDRNEWDHSPHEVNAFYDPTMNKFVLLAGILNPPFYDPDSDHSQKYGGIGFVIGHEIGHAFDDSGSQFDEQGNMHNWWTDADRKQFNKVKEAYIRQANSYEILPQIHLNGELQIGEILGDATGARLALLALDKVIASQNLDKKSTHRKFFEQLAKVWREKYRPEVMTLLIATDPHPPGKFRTDGIVRNMTSFHEAFETKPGDKMYVSPSSRLGIW